MTVHLIFTGSELLSGEVMNTNAHYLCRQLAAAGMQVKQITTVGDDLTALTKAIRHALADSMLVVVCGGLGPTEDDLTREALALAVNRPLSFSDEAWRQISSFFQRRNLPITASNQKQALLPKGADILKNPFGTAPGVFLSLDNKAVFLMPGPPHEFTKMTEDYLLPHVKQYCSLSEGPPQLVIRVTGIGEAAVADTLKALPEISRVNLALTAAPGEVDIKLSPRRESPAAARQAIDQAKTAVYASLGRYIYGEGDITLEEAVGRLLLRHRLTIATAESCTGGLLSHRLTMVPGSSAYFPLGLITYANTWKENLLGVPQELLEQQGAVSAEVAKSMARGVREKAGTDLGLGITGIAGPGGGTEEKPVGLVFIALAGKEKTSLRKFLFHGDRATIKTTSARMALTMAFRYLSQK